MTATTSSTTPASTRLHLLLWVVQLLLGLAFASAGWMKTMQPIAELAAAMGWPGEMPAGVVRFIGISELLGGIGLILPAATRILPWLTPLAGAGLAVVMLLAALFHVMRAEWTGLPINIVLGALAVFVAWGRSKKAPIAAR